MKTIGQNIKQEEFTKRLNYLFADSFCFPKYNTMNKAKNRSSTSAEDLEAKAIRKELRRIVKNYTNVIDMIDATLQFKEPTPRSKEPHSWKKLLKIIFKHFKIK